MDSVVVLYIARTPAYNVLGPEFDPFVIVTVVGDVGKGLETTSLPSEVKTLYFVINPLPAVNTNDAVVPPEYVVVADPGCPGVEVPLDKIKLDGAPGVAATTVMELLLVTVVVPLSFVDVTLQAIAFPISATTVEYVEEVAPEIFEPALVH